ALGSDWLTVKGDVGSEFNFTVETGPITGPFVEVFRLPLSHKTLFSIDSIDRSNPFKAPPPETSGRVDVTVDLNFEPGIVHTIGAPDAVRIDGNANGNLVISVNGKNVRPGVPLDHVRSIKVIGSGRDEAFTVVGTRLAV